MAWLWTALAGYTSPPSPAFRSSTPVIPISARSGSLDSPPTWPFRGPTSGHSTSPHGKVSIAWQRSPRARTALGSSPFMVLDIVDLSSAYDGDSYAMLPNRAMNPTVQQRRFACCCPAGYRDRWAD